MKNNFLLGLAIASVMFTSCGEDDTASVSITDNSVTTTNNTDGGSTVEGETILLNGNYSSDLVLDPINEYILDGPVIIESGATITIPAGMTVKANIGTEVYLAISQGAQIIAEGTPSNPVVFTSNATAPNAGDWGGLILLGEAPINSVDGVAATTATSEIASLPYGGSNVSDNSGTLLYVRVEYSGGKVDGQSENNGVSLYGVGNGTSINFVQVFEGLDDGFEFFGGTVDASFIAVANSDDDSIDWTEGYSGTLTDVYVKQNIDGDKAFECDGYNTDIGNNSDFFSAPTVTNVTIDGVGAAVGKEAERLRAGTQGTFSNIVINGYAEAFDLDGDMGDNPTGQGVLDGVLSVSGYNPFEDDGSGVLENTVTLNVKNDTTFDFEEADFLTVDSAAAGTDFATWGAGWTRQ